MKGKAKTNNQKGNENFSDGEGYNSWKLGGGRCLLPVKQHKRLHPHPRGKQIPGPAHIQHQGIYVCLMMSPRSIELIFNSTCQQDSIQGFVLPLLNAC